MKVAVLGATGAVGRTILRALEDRLPHAEELVPLASPRSAGGTLHWKGRDWTIRAPAPGVFEGCELALFSAGADRSREWAPRAVEEGSVVIDNSSAWRMDPEVPLVVPEVNGRAIADRPRGIIANPNCSTIQLTVAVEPLRRSAGVRRLVVSTYQSVSGAGQRGLDQLRLEQRGQPEQREEHDQPEPGRTSPFPERIANNVIPWIGPASSDGWTEEEDKIRNESRKILGLPELAVAATCVRVPVEVGHGMAVAVELERELGVKDAAVVFAEAEGLEFHDPAPGPLPAGVAGGDAVRVGRLRADRDMGAVVHIWVVADNLRKGAATNAVQIAERVAGG